jgi:prepilin-type N-terminal cleavage/methylation domain-containing protein/prepilin-type processing-associated H-X9-DG protein
VLAPEKNLTRMKTAFPSVPARRRRAFTLIELLTVIAIIGILAAILIPVVAQVREQAKVAQCAVHLRDIGAAVHLYANDRNDRTPPFFDGGNMKTEWGSRVDIHGHIGLLLAREKGGVRLPGLEAWSGDYLDSAAPLICPATPDSLYSSAATPRYKRPEEISASNPIGRVGYLFFYRRPDDVRTNASIREHPNRPYVLDFPAPGTSQLPTGNFPQNPHPNRVNVLHVGGHVTSFGTEELLNLPGATISGVRLFDYLGGEWTP